jgi:DNA-binding transcriptional LysR family regulator
VARDAVDEIAVFAMVAQTRSFKKTAAEFGVSPAVIGLTVRRLENRLGYRLVTRTPRGLVTTTETGKSLLARLTPQFRQITDLPKG